MLPLLPCRLSKEGKACFDLQNAVKVNDASRSAQARSTPKIMNFMRFSDNVDHIFVKYLGNFYDDFLTIKAQPLASTHGIRICIIFRWSLRIL